MKTKTEKALEKFRQGIDKELDKFAIETGLTSVDIHLNLDSFYEDGEFKRGAYVGISFKDRSDVQEN